MAQLRAVVIGCGRMGAGDQSRLEGSIPSGWLPLSHVEALLSVPDVDLVGLCDADERRLRERGAHYGINTLETDYRRLIDSVKPDLVTIATRTPGRADIVRFACSRAVKGLYVEKPLANTIEECRSALDAARAANAVVCYGVNRRYHAAYRRAREVAASGEIGEVREITVESGRSQLLWTHPHSADLLLQFAGAGSPQQVLALLEDASVAIASSREIDSDPIVEHAMFRFDNGVIGTISQTAGWNVRIAGTKGNLAVIADGSRIEVDQSRGPYFLDRKVVPHPIDAGATVTAMSELVRDVRSSSSVGVPGLIEDGLRMLLGCVWSHLHGGSLVSLRDVPADLRVSGRYGEIFA